MGNVLAFDRLPVAISPETIDMVTNEHLKIQREKFVDLSNPNYTNEMRAAIVYGQLAQIADFPDVDNADEIIRLAAYMLEWVEVLNG